MQAVRLVVKINHRFGVFMHRRPEFIEPFENAIDMPMCDIFSAIKFIADRDGSSNDLLGPCHLTFSFTVETCV